MDDTRKSVKVLIMGKSYLITTDHDVEVVQEAARLVDTLMQSKADVMPLNNEGKFAIIVALQLATELAEKNRQLECWMRERDQISALLT